ncbi:hypothetical protein DCAR_0622739 [Daucus carota subsp. sativus]|uniref:DUF4408 domain-containing protein n=1 Tax=Daucus carota subsp. sativus TaxID=79200 RepID=A0AAF0XA61_DAUCS|nr:hypothetical protein DCAR_0622680 [Daucus carota subsp. sativus]WOH03342.1 hypothetical protein DCAR_0622739 [Daucus carota subsp. sativus]
MAKDLFGNRGKSRLETTFWAIQLLLLFVGFISIILLFKTAVIPYSFSKVSTLPQLWLSLKFWLSPPYIYVLINIIIVFVVFTSSFYHPKINEDQHEYVSPRLQDEGYGDTLSEVVPPEPSSVDEINENEDVDFIFFHETPKTLLPLTGLDTSKIVSSEKTTKEEGKQSPSSEHFKHVLVTEEPVTENIDKEFDTMEATWEAIIEAGKLPEKKQLKKTETWNAPPVVMPVAGRKEMRKYETFNESVLGRQRGGLQRDMSIGQAELNHRIEAFISKFNKDMRLQRQESEQRFLEMINR